MNLTDFSHALSDSLVKRGIPLDVARRHISKLIPTLTNEDIREIESFTSAEDFTDISDLTAAMLAQTSTTPKVTPAKNVTRSIPAAKPAVKPTAVKPTPAKPSAEKPEEKSAAMPSAVKPSTAKPAVKPEAASVPEVYGEDAVETIETGTPVRKKPEKYRETPEGRNRFILTTVCVSPLFALAFIIYFALWGIAFGAEIAAIVFFIAALIACAAGGVGCAVGGVIYGVVTLGDVPSAGIYEIGFGIVIAGVTFLACILIYNFALRFMPYAVKKTAHFCGFCFGKVRELLKEYRRWCFVK